MVKGEKKGWELYVLLGVNAVSNLFLAKLVATSHTKKNDNTRLKGPDIFPLYYNTINHNTIHNECYVALDANANSLEIDGNSIIDLKSIISRRYDTLMLWICIPLSTPNALSLLYLAPISRFR